MVPQHHIMSHLHQVVDLGPLANDGGTQGASVDGHIGPDLDIVANDDVADLRHLPVNAAVLDVTKAIRADDRSAVDADAIADLRPGIKGDVGEQVRVFPDPAVRANMIGALEHRAGTYPRLGPDHAVRTNVGGRINLRPGRHQRRRVEARLKDGLREKQMHHLGEGDPSVGHPNEDLARRDEGPVHDDR